MNQQLEQSAHHYLELVQYCELQDLEEYFQEVNYLDNKGKVDITHLINFDLLKKIFKRSGLKVNGLISQELFLKKIGIFERAEFITQNLPFLQKSDIYYRINRLTDKKQMGDLFNVIFASSPNINFKFGFK